MLLLSVQTELIACLMTDLIKVWSILKGDNVWVWQTHVHFEWYSNLWDSVLFRLHSS